MTRPKSTSFPEASDACDASAMTGKGSRGAHGHEVRLAKTFAELLGDDETTDESASDIIRAVRVWHDVTSLRSLD